MLPAPEHTGVGAEFQKAVQEHFIKKYGAGFEPETAIPIGDPEKAHCCVNLTATRFFLSF